MCASMESVVEILIEPKVHSILYKRCSISSRTKIGLFDPSRTVAAMFETSTPL